MRLYRNDFPAATRRASYKQPVYLNAAGGTLMPHPVLAAMDDYNRQVGAVPGFGANNYDARANLALEESRGQLAAFCGALRKDELVFTKNATEALNLAAFCYGSLVLSAGDAVVATALEHPANRLPWQRTAKAAGANFVSLECDGEGNITDSAIEAAIGPKTRIVAFSQVSYLLGTALPWQKILRRAKEVGAVTVLDACQSLRAFPVDLHALDVDFAAGAAYKLYGPPGVGFLYGRAPLLAAMPPLLAGEAPGAEGEALADAPARFEAGSQNAAAALGLAAATRYVAGAGFDETVPHIELLTGRLLAGLAQIPGLLLLGSETEKRHGIVAFALEGIDAEAAAGRLDASGVAVAAGAFGARAALAEMGVQSCLRASFGLYNTDRDVDALLEALLALPRYGA